MSKLRWGIIGPRGFFQQFIESCKMASNAEFTAVLDSDLKKANSFCQTHGINRSYDQLSKFLKDDHIDAIWIWTPNYLHCEQTIHALNAGKHVLCEKPMALDVNECKQMIQAAKQSKKKLFIGYMLRFHPELCKLKQIIDSEAFGKLTNVHMKWFYPYNTAPNLWRQQFKTSGGWAINDLGTHLLDLLIWYFGEPIHVNGELSNFGFNFETDDYALINCRFTNGVVATIEVSTSLDSITHLEFYGTKKYYAFETDNILTGLPAKISNQHKNQSTIQTLSSKVELYRNQIESISQIILTNNSTPFIAIPEEGLQNIKVISKVVSSAATMQKSHKFNLNEV